MILLERVVKAWGRPEFERVLKQALLELDAKTLLLQQGLQHSSHALTEGMSVLINRVGEEDGRILVRVGIFYSGIIAGCSCADDPSPVDPVTEYLELLLEIDRETAAASIRLLAEE